MGERPSRHEIAPGAVHLPGWLPMSDQVRLGAAFEEWAGGPVPARAPSLPGGGRMSVETVCLGWHWLPYRYTRTADDVNGRRVLPFPDWLGGLARAAVHSAHGAQAAERYRPDAALVNRYREGASMGMHQDKEEQTADPVVSFSVGDSCVFRFGNAEGRGRPYTDVRLDSGDAFVFGGPSRFAHHGVPKLFPRTAPHGCGLVEGRLNITVRVVGAAG
ncbi:MAG: alpha-ketoglutarate-dependent dioxygenase AlkB family protein [Segniliparus sp.]|uniref:alpha-ketoglutarate-dependent dioxygenase AlkB family protein n=1 Tax=Segniliparus sp. TaxID=2804064 RepID=UPI003F380D36